MNDRQEDGHGDSCARPSRRDFLTRAGWLAGGMALMGVQGFRPQWAAAAVDARSFAATSALELDGQFIDFLKSAEGGFPRADVIQQPVGPNGFIKKQIGPPRYQDISIQCSPVLPKPLFDWIAATVSLSYPRKSGAIITGDFNRVEQNRLQFSNALLTEITIPACDGASKEAGYITLKWAPEFTAPLPGKGAAISAPPKNQQKAWLPSNFRLTIPGLDCSKVGKIDALTIKQSVSDGSMGAMREKQPAKLEFPNLVITLAEFSAGTFYAWSMRKPAPWSSWIRR